MWRRPAARGRTREAIPARSGSASKSVIARTCSLHRRFRLGKKLPAVHRDGLPRNVRRLVAREKQGRIGDFFHRSKTTEGDRRRHLGDVLGSQAVHPFRGIPAPQKPFSARRRGRRRPPRRLPRSPLAPGSRAQLFALSPESSRRPEPCTPSVRIPSPSPSRSPCSPR